MQPVESIMDSKVAPLPPPRGLSIERIESDGSNAIVLSFPVPEAKRHASELTNAERAVAHGILHGLTYEQVAERRGVSQRTVANQMAAVFAKLKVRSRLDLALLLRYEPSF
jgi:DNA-binding NarL/FixJ family response regulator